MVKFVRHEIQENLYAAKRILKDKSTRGISFERFLLRRTFQHRISILLKISLVNKK